MAAFVIVRTETVPPSMPNAPASNAKVARPIASFIVAVGSDMCTPVEAEPRRAPAGLLRPNNRATGDKKHSQTCDRLRKCAVRAARAGARY
jgi:hypothetical protein